MRRDGNRRQASVGANLPECGDMRRAPARFVERVPFPGACLEDVRRCEGPRRRGLLLLHGGISSVAQRGLRRLAKLARADQRDVGIAAEGEQLLLFAEPVLEAPGPIARGRRQHIESVGIWHLVRLVSGPGFLDRDVGERTSILRLWGYRPIPPTPKFRSKGRKVPDSAGVTNPHKCSAWLQVLGG